MGPEQAATTLALVREQALQRSGQTGRGGARGLQAADPRKSTSDFQQMGNFAANLWVDGVIDPLETRDVLGLLLEAGVAHAARPRASACSGSERMHKLLIANRGEIACRIARSCRRLGIAVATVHSDADAAMRCMCARSASRCAWARRRRATATCTSSAWSQARARWAPMPCTRATASCRRTPPSPRRCRRPGIAFIGPTPADAARLRRQGHRPSAEAQPAGVPVVPGSDRRQRRPGGRGRDGAHAGLPVLLKAAGRRRRQGHGRDQLARWPRGRASPPRCAKAAPAFGDGVAAGRTYLPHVRHIEVQIPATASGGVLHLFERECAAARHQKVVEEAPAHCLAHRRCATRLLDADAWRSAAT
jgi:3-methylcrotonyl-CoA carboxylase alpha subunit